MNGGSEHRSEASSEGGNTNSQHGQKGSGGKRRRRRKKKGSSHGESKSNHGEGSNGPLPAAAAAAVTNQEQGRASPSKKKAGGKPKTPKPAADMTVIVNSVYLWDVAKKHSDEYIHQREAYHQLHHQHHYNQLVAPYHFAPDMANWNGESDAPAVPRETQTIVTIRAPHSKEACVHDNIQEGALSVIDTSFPNPYPASVVHDKYWCQRRRLFSRFDMGVQLDSEGFFSVTPEIIADHVARRVADISDSAAFCRGMPGSNEGGEGIVVFDAFCGCGGNAIAFGKVPSDKVSLVVCVDIDRSKLEKAAYNASLYDIPNNKLVFIECNTMFILMNCYKNGELVLDQLDSSVANMPTPVIADDYAGYRIGGLDCLPPRIDAVFLDPPWGGVAYNRQNSYDLERNMKILLGPSEPVAPANEGVSDDFFDTFSSKPSRSNKKGAKLYDKAKDGEYANGVDLVKMAAAATKSHFVVYDLPRNTTKTSLGKSALAAGYRGNVKLEEHYLNGRLKTVTAYLGADYRSLLD